MAAMERAHDTGSDSASMASSAVASHATGHANHHQSGPAAGADSSASEMPAAVASGATAAGGSTEKKVSRSSTPRPSMFADAQYLLWLIVRAALLFVSVGFLDETEFYGKYQIELFRVFVTRESPSAVLSSLPTAETPFASVVPSYVSLAVPYAVASLAQHAFKAQSPDGSAGAASFLHEHADLLSVMLPIWASRLWMFLFSVLLDACMFHSFKFVRYEGARTFLSASASSFALLLVATRPTDAVLSTLCLSFLSFTLLGWRRKTSDILRMAACGIVLALGVLVRPSFAIFGFMIVYYVMTSFGRSDFTLLALLLWTCACWGAFVGTLVSLSLVDSFHFGFIQLSHFGRQISSLPDLLMYLAQCNGEGYCDTLATGWSVLRFEFLCAPLNLARDMWSNFASYKKVVSFAPEVFIIYIPVLLGPVLIAVGRELYQVLYQSYKEMRTELKKMGRDDASGGGTKRKRKASGASRKSRVERAQAEDLYAFSDFFQTIAILGGMVELLLSGGEPSPARMLPFIVACYVVAVPQIRSDRLLRISTAAYGIVSAVIIGFLYNSGSVRSALDIASGRGTFLVPDAQLVYFQAYPAPAHVIEQSNPMRIVVHEFPKKNESAMYDRMHEWLNADKDVFLATVPRFQLGDKTPLEVPLHISPVHRYVGHYSAGHIPPTLDELVRDAYLVIYRVSHTWDKAPRLDADEAQTFGTGARRKSSGHDQDYGVHQEL
ncbi:hypothetical protein FVE85_0190 [Porphyridium purpureum]|uniref:Mannosyltransferase n=1 Tax=Porphyridium purpureum TaxID=35688 RepID=A0A5J4YXZ0_PORPP|nr:hypothetical protein FVE85_0190 [Porphyridium purpureum]|eukprot:POR1714..scf208_2